MEKNIKATTKATPKIELKQRNLYAYSFGKITAEIDRKGLTVSALAEKAGISEATIKRFLTGNVPNHSNFLRIVLALDLSPRDVYPFPQNTTADKLEMAEQLLAEVKQEIQRGNKHKT